VIEPGAKAALAATKTQRIGVIGTEGTIESRAYSEAIHELNKNVEVFGQACPLIVPLVEEGWLDKPLALEVVKEYLLPLLEHKIDALVLGCTHYPLLKNLLSQVAGPHIPLIDSAEETARSVGESLKQHGLAAPEGHRAERRFYVSDAPEKFERTGERFLGAPLPNVKLVDIGSWI
jgi:glutamate racemase